MDTNIALLSLQLVLPAFNDFAERAKLDVPLPLVTQRATESHVSAYSPAVMIKFDKRYRFVWDTITNTETKLFGRIRFEDQQQNIARMDRAKAFPALSAQTSLIDTNEAVLIASNCLVRLGYYNTNWFKTPPVVKQYAWSEDLYEADPKMPLKPLPYFNVFWPPITPSGLDASFGDDFMFKIQISGLTKEVVELNRMMSCDVERSQKRPSKEWSQMLEVVPIPTKPTSNDGLQPSRSK